MYRTTIKSMQNGLRATCVGLIQAYQWVISPYVGPCCRFYPSCSEYAQQALEQAGVLRGAWLIFKRLLRCHPFCQGGHDPIPTQYRCKHHGNS